MKKIKYIILLLLFVNCISCNIEKQPKKKDSFSKVEINVDSLIPTLNYYLVATYGDLWYNKEFVIIHDNPSYYFSEIKKFFLKIDTNNIKVDLESLLSNSRRQIYDHAVGFKIAVIMLEDIEVDKYLEICYIGINIFDMGLIWDTYILELIRGEFNKSPILDNLCDEEVQKFLHIVVEHPKINREIKEIIYSRYLKRLNPMKRLITNLLFSFSHCNSTDYYFECDGERG